MSPLPPSRRVGPDSEETVWAPPSVEPVIVLAPTPPLPHRHEESAWNLLPYNGLSMGKEGEQMQQLTLGQS